jgi:phosphoglycolate phosphatase
MYKTILFDFDGTLFDTGEGVMKSVQYAARALGYAADDLSELRAFVGPPLRDMFRKKYHADDETVEALVAKYRERYSSVGVLECSPYPGMAGLVRSLREAGRTVAVATGKPTAYTEDILAAHGMADAFDAVLGSEFDGVRSQKWEVISELLARFGSDDAVMVGDRDNDVFGAAKCGLSCIGVSFGFAEPGELESAGAIRIVKDAGELKNILLG